MQSFLLAADGTEPAGGAAAAEVIGATAGAVVATVVLLALGIGHRSGRVLVLGRLAAFSQRISGLPGWAALPVGLATGSLLTAVFGMYWDISLHIDEGRDAGPLANPAHYFILFGLFGIFAAGYLAMVLPKERPGPTAIRIQEDWHAPLGGVVVLACGAFSLIGFPLDDMWHRLFGQDVTLWGPTHLMLIGGASMTLIGLAVLLVEASRANAAAGRPDRERSWALTARKAALPGGLLIGLSTFQAEFDFSVPQFRFVFQPMLIMLAAGVGLVATRMWLGRGSALLAVAFFLLVRGLLTLLVGPVLGQTTPSLPLYVVEALVVEAVALRYARRPLAFGLLAGLGIGTLGLAGEWGWSHLAMHQPWPAELLPEALLLGLPMALAGGVIGAWVGSRLCAESVDRPPVLRPLAVAAAAALAVMVAYALQDDPSGEPVRAQVQVQETRGGAQREGNLVVALDPPDAADGAEWLTLTAWQGGGSIVEPLEEIGPGRYRTAEPVPLHGSWKSLIRLHTGRELQIMPVFMPEDRAIPAKEIPAPARFERAFVAEPEVLLREQTGGGGATWVLAYGVVASIALALLALIAWALHRLAAHARGPAGATTSAPPAERRTGPRVGRHPTPA
ncbi:MAG TPA: hypothetical protein VGW75_03210 [Solirubrobacteraceae bacterium]|jgi:hypothetical protein|nr:hypothetical protein [Solirubrobacteraceae bacterium]